MLTLAIRVTRAPFLTASLVPVLLGAAVARYEQGSLHLGLLALTLLGALAVHAGLNMSNDYHDHLSGNDAAHRNPTPFSGGSRVIQEGLLEPRTVLLLSVGASALGAAIGLMLSWLRGWHLLWIGLIGIALGWAHSGPPLRLCYRGRGLGELAVAIGFGPLMVLGSYYVQAQRLSWSALAASLPVALQIAAVLTVNALPDVEADRVASKQTLPVAFGRRVAMRAHAVEVLGSHTVLASLVAVRFAPPWVLLGLLGLPLGVYAVAAAAKAGGRAPAMLPANAATIQGHLATGLLLTAGYLLGGP